MALPSDTTRLYENGGLGPLIREELIPKDEAAGFILGEIRPLPFRAGSLPWGWWACVGDYFAKASDVGKALLALPAQLRADWGIAESGNSVCVPNLIDPGTGYGYFPRFADGVSRQVGTAYAQADAGRNVAGEFGQDEAYLGNAYAQAFAENSSYAAGCFEVTAAGKASVADGAGSAAQIARVRIDASRNWGSAHTADEFRPMNVGFTPAIFLGV